MPFFGKDKDSKKSRNADKNVTLTVQTTSITTTLSDGPPRAGEVFSKQFAAGTAAEGRADKIHDTVTNFTDQYANAKALYTTNKDIIQGAWDAMAGATGIGRTLDDWIGPINKVLTGLEGLAKAQPFPFVELAVKLFNGVVQLELQRRQNSARARALILQMADMLGALLQLHFVEDPTLTTETGQSVAGRIQVLMGDIEKDINDTGNLINKYHEHSLAAKFFRSGQYATTFKAAADTLVSRKGDIQYACTIHITVTVDEIRKQVRETNTMIVKLTQIIEHQSEKEKECERVLAQNGGRKRVLENTDLTMQVAAQIEGRDLKEDITGLPGGKPSDKAKPEGGKPKALNKPALLAGGQLAFSRAELLELKQPLEKILQDSLPYYENKLLAQVEAGSHEKIVHPDIRFVWKEMGWRSSVEARQFVMGLHDYYLDRYALAAAKENAVTTITTTLTVTLTSPGEFPPVSPIEEAGSPTSVEFKSSQTNTTKKSSLTSDASIIADKDYRQYLTMPYIAAIAQAFDDDASGFIRISEVNDFCASIPDGWTLLQWIAFWAFGWMVEASYYSALIGEIIEAMNDCLGDTLAENHSMIFRFLVDGDWMDVVTKLALSAHEKCTIRTDSSLDNLVKAHMAQKEEQLEKRLEGFNFYLDSPESMGLVTDPGRVEKDLFSLLFVVLRRHLRLIALAKTKVLDEHEVSSAWYTMSHISQNVRDRVKELQSNFKHQGLDVDIEMSRYAGGVYEFLHTDNIPDDVEGLSVPGEEHDAVRQMLLPGDMDMSRLSKSDPWFDISAYAKDEAEGDTAGDDSNEKATASAKTKSYRSPLLIPNGSELASMATEHKDNLSEIWSEVAAFITKLTEQLSNKRSRHPVPGALALLTELGEAQREDTTKSEIGTKILDNIVQIVCAFTRLPDVEDDDAPKGTHDGFIRRIAETLEPLCNELAYILRLYKAYQKATAPTELAPDSGAVDEGVHAPAPVTTTTTFVSPAETVVDPELIPMVDRMSRHAPIVAAAIDAHTGSGIARFRGAAHIVQSQIQDRHYKYTWAFLKRRGALRRRFVDAYAVKMKFDDDYQCWEIYHPGTEEAEETYNALLREVPSIDRPLYASLARWTYRKLIVHIGRRCDVCQSVLVGPRHACLYCNDFDLCSDCAQLRLRDVRDGDGKLHHVWHPLIRCSRPIIQISHHNQFKIMFRRLYKGQDISPNAIYDASSDESSSGSEESGDGDEDDDEDDDGDNTDEATSGEEGDDAESASTSEPEENSGDPVVETDNDKDNDLDNDGPQNATGDDGVSGGENDGEKNITSHDFAEGSDAQSEEDDESPDSYNFECANCKKTKTGTRFLRLPQYDSLQYCPECAEKLVTPVENKPLDAEFRVLLKCTLPFPEDDETSTVAGEDEEENEQQKLAERLTAVDGRLEALENRFNGMDEMIQGVEAKLDQILDILTALRPASSHETAIETA